MEKLIAILEDIRPDIDYSNCEDLIDAHRLDSLSVISLIAEIEDEFDVSVPAYEIIPDNFNSAQKIMDLINKLSEED